MQINLEVQVDCSGPGGDCAVGNDDQRSSSVHPLPLGEVPSSLPYKAGHGVKPPKVIQSRDPELTDEERAKAKSATYQGTVKLSLVVDENGAPQNVRLVQGVSQDLDQKVILAVKKWRFEPGTKDGKPVPVEINVELNLNLY